METGKIMTDFLTDEEMAQQEQGLDFLSDDDMAFQEQLDSYHFSF